MKPSAVSKRLRDAAVIQRCLSSEQPADRAAFENGARLADHLVDELRAGRGEPYAIAHALSPLTMPARLGFLAGLQRLIEQSRPPGGEA